MDGREKVLQEIVAERERQESLSFSDKPADEFDKDNSQEDWVAIVVAYAGRAAGKVARNRQEGQSFRENMVKVAAVALAAVEAHDRGRC
jgi:hypothetical protein